MSNTPITVTLSGADGGLAEHLPRAARPAHASVKVSHIRCFFGLYYRDPELPALRLSAIQ
jgi:hypothetical protein